MFGKKGDMAGMYAQVGAEAVQKEAEWAAKKAQEAKDAEHNTFEYFSRTALTALSQYTVDPLSPISKERGKWVDQVKIDIEEQIRRQPHHQHKSEIIRMLRQLRRKNEDESKKLHFASEGRLKDILGSVLIELERVHGPKNMQKLEKYEALLVQREKESVRLQATQKEEKAKQEERDARLETILSERFMELSNKTLVDKPTSKPLAAFGMRPVAAAAMFTPKKPEVSPDEALRIKALNIVLDYLLEISKEQRRDTPAWHAAARLALCLRDEAKNPENVANFISAYKLELREENILQPRIYGDLMQIKREIRSLMGKDKPGKEVGQVEQPKGAALEEAAPKEWKFDDYHSEVKKVFAEYQTLKKDTTDVIALKRVHLLEDTLHELVKEKAKDVPSRLELILTIKAALRKNTGLPLPFLRKDELDAKLKDLINTLEKQYIVNNPAGYIQISRADEFRQLKEKGEHAAEVEEAKEQRKENPDSVPLQGAARRKK